MHRTYFRLFEGLSFQRFSTTVPFVKDPKNRIASPYIYNQINEEIYIYIYVHMHTHT